MSEAIYIILMCLSWTIPFVFFIPQWFWMMLVIDGVFAAFEMWNKMHYGMTLSQRFWRWSVDKTSSGKYRNLSKVIATLGLMLVGWLMLIVHLAWKLLKKK